MPASGPVVTAGDLDIAGLDPVVTPAPPDGFVVTQGAGDNLRETRQQIHILEPAEVLLIDAGLVGAPGLARNGDPTTGVFFPALDQMGFAVGGVQAALLTEAAGVVQLILPQQNNEAQPSLALSLTGTGFFARVANEIRVSIGGTAEWIFTAGGDFESTLSNAAGLRGVGASATVPTLIPDRANDTTGIGQRIADVGVLIGGAQNCMEFGGVGVVPQVGFYGTAAVNLQTGVPVTAVAIHAALVTLGLITA